MTSMSITWADFRPAGFAGRSANHQWITRGPLGYGPRQLIEEDIRRREDLEIPPDIDDLSVMPGEIIDATLIEREQTKAALVDLVRRMGAERLSWSGEAVGISWETVAAAEAFIRDLPLCVKSPKISPDGEGGLMVVWDEPPAPTLVIIDGWRLHLVKAATTPNAEYHDDIGFTEGSIPSVVLDALPVR